MARDLSGRADARRGLRHDERPRRGLDRSAASTGGCEDLVVVGMGKLGGRELNVSSDIDLVFVHAGDADERRATSAPARRLIRLLSERDRGRLRVPRRHAPAALRRFRARSPAASTSSRRTSSPRGANGSATPGSRRARSPATGATQRSTRIVRPFVFRKYLDYATLGAMRALHAEVRRDVARRELAEHVKLGPGGIREIEFIVQALQLIRGGRDPELRRAARRCEALPILARKNLLPPDSGGRAGARPTSSCATSSTACSTSTTRSAMTCPRTARTARASPRMCGLRLAGTHSTPSCARHRDRGVAAFRRGLRRARERAARSRGPSIRASPRCSRASAMRRCPAESRAPPRPRRCRRSRAGRARDAGPPRRRSRAASTWSRRSPAAPPTSRCSPSTREALERVARIVGASSWAAEYVTRHPLLLDELLDDRVLYAPLDLDAGGAKPARAARRSRRRRRAAHEHAARGAPGAGVPPAGAGPRRPAYGRAARRPPSALADLVLESRWRSCWRDLPPPPPRARRASRSSPTASSAARSSATPPTSTSSSSTTIARRAARARGLRAPRAAHQQLAHAAAPRRACCSRPTCELRPSGASGLLVSLARRLRALPGGRRLGLGAPGADARALSAPATRQSAQRFEAIRAGDPARSRETPRRSRRDRRRCARSCTRRIPNRSGLFDLKHDRGGMIDIEFSVQYLVLAHRAPLSRADRQPGQHRAARHGRRARPDPEASSPSAAATPTASSAGCSTRCA